MKKVLPSVRLMFLVITVSQVTTATSTTSDIQETTESLFTSSGLHMSSAATVTSSETLMTTGTTSTWSMTQETTESLFTSREPYFSSVAISTSFEILLTTGTISALSEIQETTEPLFTSLEPHLSSLSASTSSETLMTAGATSTTADIHDTTEPLFTLSEPHVSSLAPSTSAETLMTTGTTSVSSVSLLTTGRTSAVSESQVTNSTSPLSSYPTTDSTTLPASEIQSDSTSPMTIYTAANSTSSWTPFPITNLSTFSTTYPTSNFTTTLYTTEEQTNSTLLLTSDTQYNYTSAASTTYINSTLSLTTYPTTNSTTTSWTSYPTNNYTTSFTSYIATNSTTSSSTSYPAMNFTTTSLYTTEARSNSTLLSTNDTQYNYTSAPSTTYMNSTTASIMSYLTTNYTTTTEEQTNSTPLSTNDTQYNYTSAHSTTYPNSTTASLMSYLTTNSTTTEEQTNSTPPSTSDTQYNYTSAPSTTYPNSTTASLMSYLTTNYTTTEEQTNSTSLSTSDIQYNYTSAASTTYTNSTLSLTTYPTTSSATTSWTSYPTNNYTTTSWTSYLATNSTTSSSTSYPAMNSTTTSLYTTEARTNSTLLMTSDTQYNYTSAPSTTYSNSTTASLMSYLTTNSTTSSTSYPTTNSTTTSSTSYPTTNFTTSSTLYPTISSITSSTLYPTTSSTSYPTTNSTTSPTSYRTTNSTSSSTSYRITNSTLSSTVISTTTASFLEGVAFEYGTAKGDSVFTGIDDACYPEVTSSLQFPIYGILYRSMYICSNGIVSFDERITTPGPPWDDIGLQSQGSYLAPYFNDLDFRRYWSSGEGVIYYHAYDIIEDNSLKNNSNVIKARDYVRNYETDQKNFNPTFLLVVTWERASPYPVYYRQSEHVTFQLALVTDGLNTFVSYIYFPGQMLFSYNYVFIGYSFANSGILKKDMNSFTTGALRMDNNAVTSGIRGILYYRLTPVGFHVNNDQRICRAWWSENRYLRWYNSWMNAIMPPCPCTMNLLWWDSSFGSYYFEGPNTYCAVVQPRWWYSPHGKTCCYNIRTGQYQQTAPNAGGFLQYHKTLYPRQYQAVDQRMKEYCCSRTNLCHLYYDLRPVSWCYSRFPFFFAFFWGDPHIETLDKKKFTFNGWGEYTLVSLDTTNTTFILQSRTARAMKADGNYTDATIFSAFAAKDNVGANIHVELNETKNGVIIYAKSNANASSFVDFTTDFADMSKEFNVQDEYLSLSRDDASRTFTAVFSSGISLNVSVGVQMLSVSVVLPTEFKGQPKGLLGNFDENPDNDFQCPNGTTLPSNISEQDIFKYGQTWEVIGDESVFHYPLGKNHSNFQHSNFTPKFLDEADQAKVNKSKQSCGEDNQECIFDLVFTENEAVANNTRNIESRASNGQSELENEVPQISGNSTVYAYVGKNVTVNVNGSDDGSFSFKFLNNTANASVILVNNNTRTVSGLVYFFLKDTNPVSMSLTVEDNRGVQAPALDLTMLVCSGCSNHGNCSFTQEREDNRSTTRFKYVTCICSPFWEGDDCERDLDGCATRPCSSLRNCTDNPADVHEMLNRTYNCSSCPDGYTDGVEDPAKCIDINECNATNATHGCNQTCVNTEGSYYCTCNSAFRLHSNGKDCQDIDECLEGMSGCDQECNNTYGGYICGCKNGYIYNNTRQECVQENATICPTKNCTGADGCTTNETGQEVCFCRSGYQLTATDLCEDVDECKQHICSQVCENVQGGFHCKCNKGYTLGIDKTSCIQCAQPHYGDNCSSTCTCGRGAIRCDPLSGCVCESGWTGTSCDQDVNECTQNPNICNNTLKTCMNTMGSYTCSCVSGYQANNNTCIDINECGDVTLNTCEQRCINSLGGFSCGCLSGYNTDPGNSTKCVDIDECTAGQSGCQQICENSPGRFSCSCNFGYALTEDRKTCIQVENPCKQYGNITCDQICLVDLQARTSTCSCNLGFKLAADNKTCEDINECNGDGSLNNCSSNAVCQNTNGSYVCSCNTGFKLENDGRTCSECDSFHYGINCSSDCNCSVGAERCDKLSGCVCKNGWNGTKCDTDIDECSNTSLCTGANIYCLNTLGSYQCVCESGYNKTNGICEDIDECTQNVCSYNCTNTNGSYQCSCQSGYKVNGSYCIDIDECLRGEDDCSQGCQNKNGSYECVCYSGYELNGTACTPLPGQNMTSSDITFTFDIQIAGNLNDTNTYDKYLYDANQTLYNYFKTNMGEYFISIENITLSKGSLIAAFVLLMQDSTNADASLVTYLTNALNEQFVFGGINVSLQSLGVGAYTASNSGGLCALYESIVGTCPSGYKCTVSGGHPSCGPDDKEKDKVALIIGLSVGLPLGAILIAVVIVLVMKLKKNKIRDLAICGGRWPKREMLYPIGEDRKQSGHSRNILEFDDNNLKLESDENEASNGTHGKSWPLSKAEV
ncbi:hypothetical protein CHS0354_035649 [Potamilus streckersoni]|uniref:Mucin-like protein n=1 Tax=Potamilus streckersoni TaxID=2493646 RepID=A0AAE0SAV9_9BIVA|nr:hypothetical protein CHS0354_035649 [Potamilus streckersoni]